MVINPSESCMCSASLTYVSTGCNRTPQALSWGKNGLIAYGGSNSVVLYKSELPNSAGKVISVLNKHKDRVNCVHWIEENNGLNSKLISGSSDRTAVLWEKKEDIDEWKPVAELTGHSDAICSVSGITVKENTGRLVCLLATSAADSTVRIWKFTDDEGIDCLQILKFGNGFALCLAMAILPHSEVPVLALGCDDTLVHLYTLERHDNALEFQEVQKLQGHEDWIRSLAFTLNGKNELMLASGAQDCFIRVWNIKQKCESTKETGELRLPEKTLSVVEQGIRNLTFTVTLETVLAGHEGWVYGLSWRNQRLAVSGNRQEVNSTCLLSASMDKTVMLWEPAEDSGLWIDKARMGEVGGNTLGFYGCAFSPDGDAIIAHGFQGAFHLWKRHHGPVDTWTSDVTIGGHFGPVEDFDWDPTDGTFLISVSADQTARLHGPWEREGSETTWHEIARPQIHGYDLQCITMINRYLYAAGAEEKVIRIFRAPRKFHECLSVVCGVKEDEKAAASLPLGASVPPLGLSNKAVFEGDLESWKVGVDDISQPMKASAFASEDPLPFTPISISAPPPEDILLQNTLWPEEQKLYGHGYEVFCLASDPQGTTLASACKASKEEHANILLWDTSTWTQIGSLRAHSLTVTQMAFSHNGNMLVSVSRDRTWALFSRSVKSECPFQLLQKSDKKTSCHTRIIWSCAWTKDDNYFITASRDKKVVVWEMDVSTGDSRWGVRGEPLTLEDAVTAVDAAPLMQSDSSYIFAAGMECGKINILGWKPSASPNWQILLQLQQECCPTLTVKRLKWSQATTTKDNSIQMKLACASMDASMRIIAITVTTM